MEWVVLDNILRENGSHKLTGGDSIYTEHIRSRKFPAKEASVTIEGLWTGDFQTSVP